MLIRLVLYCLAAVMLAAPAHAELRDLKKIVLSSDAAPDVDGATFHTVYSPQINNRGDIIFDARLMGEGISYPNENTVYIYNGPRESLIARGGEVAPETGGAVMQAVSVETMTDDGLVLFGAYLIGGNANEQGAWFTRDGAETRYIVGNGDPVDLPEIAPILRFYDAWARDPFHMNNKGEIVFFANFAGAGQYYQDNTGLFQVEEVGYRKLVRGGEFPPGAGGLQIRTLNPHRGEPGFTDIGEINDNGDVVYVANLLDVTGPPTSKDHLLLIGPGGGSIRARRYDPAPGDGGYDHYTFFEPKLNNFGDIAFHGLVIKNNATKLAIHRLGPSGDRRIALEGEAAPGAEGLIYGFLGSIGTIALNNNAETVFLAGLQTPGEPFNPTDLAVYLNRADGTNELIVRSGDTIDLGGGDVRTVYYPQTSAHSINDHGQITIRITFTDYSTGIFRYGPDIDEDGDGVFDEADLCPGTVIPEAAPTSGDLGNGRYALTMVGDMTFAIGEKSKSNERDDEDDRRDRERPAYTTADTGGCSCEQIVDGLHLGKGHLKHGCSNGAMKNWILGVPLDPTNP